VQHFLLSKAAKTLSLAQVFRMTDAEAETAFRKLRWPDTDGAPVCPSCGSVDAYECRRPKGALRFRCKGCKEDFSVTSGTLFASHKLPLKSYLAAIAVFCNEVKGKSALALSRDLGVSYKCAFVLQHKFREAMAEEMKGRVVGGEAGSTPSNLISARSRASTNTSITRTGLLSSMKSSRHSGNSIHCPRSASSTKRASSIPPESPGES
jgi:transposase-like protein